jgi:hypothetical protein
MDYGHAASVSSMHDHRAGRGSGAYMSDRRLSATNGENHQARVDLAPEKVRRGINGDTIVRQTNWQHDRT